MKLVSTPNFLISLTADSPRGFDGSAVAKETGRPNCASETATFASAPPNVASSRGDWNNRSNPGDLRRNITSPNVTTRVIGLPPRLHARRLGASALLLHFECSIDRLAHFVANAVELPRADPFRRRHPGTSARDDARAREISTKIRQANPAAREKSDVAVRSRHRFQIRD